MKNSSQLVSYTTVHPSGLSNEAVGEKEGENL